MSAPGSSTLRDRIAWRLANLVLNLVATKRYRDLIEGAIWYGLSSVARDVQEGRSTPTPWRDL